MTSCEFSVRFIVKGFSFPRRKPTYRAKKLNERNVLQTVINDGGFILK